MSGLPHLLLVGEVRLLGQVSAGKVLEVIVLPGPQPPRTLKTLGTA